MGKSSAENWLIVARGLGKGPTPALLLSGFPAAVKSPVPCHTTT